MVNQAIAKIQTEMDAAKNNSYVQVVGKYLLDHLKANPGSAEKIMAEEKTIAKSLDDMRKVAEKQRFGNCAVLTDAEGFAVVLKYFGIEAACNPITPVNPVPKKEVLPFSVSLEELL